jgi:hypothetical protein
MSSKETIIAEFNNWAKAPTPTLPQGFEYVDGKVALREKFQTVKSNANAPWIESTQFQTANNRAAKLLYPNPQVLDQLASDADKIYNLKGNRSGRGKNGIEITDPAIMINENGNWIEYKGSANIFPALQTTQDTSANNRAPQNSPAPSNIDREIEECQKIIAQQTARLNMLLKQKASDPDTIERA